MFMVAYFFSAS